MLNIYCKCIPLYYSILYQLLAFSISAGCEISIFGSFLSTDINDHHSITYPYILPWLPLLHFCIEILSSADIDNFDYMHIKHRIGKHGKIKIALKCIEAICAIAKHNNPIIYYDSWSLRIRRVEIWQQESPSY